MSPKSPLKVLHLQSDYSIVTGFSMNLSKTQKSRTFFLFAWGRGRQKSQEHILAITPNVCISQYEYGTNSWHLKHVGTWTTAVPRKCLYKKSLLYMHTWTLEVLYARQQKSQLLFVLNYWIISKNWSKVGSCHIHGGPVSNPNWSFGTHARRLPRLKWPKIKAHDLIFLGWMLQWKDTTVIPCLSLLKNWEKNTACANYGVFMGLASLALTKFSSTLGPIFRPIGWSRS